MPEKNIALRGPLRSTHLPPKAAERPSMTMEMLKMTPIAVSEVSKRSTRGLRKTLKAYTWPMDRCTASAAGGMNHRL